MKKIFIPILASTIFASCTKVRTYNCAYFYERNKVWELDKQETKQFTEKELTKHLAANNKGNIKVICKEK